MRWPWVSRRLYEVALKAAENADARAAHIEQDKDAAMIGYESRLGAMEERMQDQDEAHRAERQVLLDRIVQRSGQPPIYQKPEAVPVKQAAEPEYRGPVAEGVLTEKKLRDMYKQQQSGMAVVKGA